MPSSLYRLNIKKQTDFVFSLLLLSAHLLTTPAHGEKTSLSRSDLVIGLFIFTLSVIQSPEKESM